MRRKFIATFLSLGMALFVSAIPAEAKVAKTYNFKVTGKIQGAAGKTVLLVADTGRVLGSQSISGASQNLSITSSVKSTNLSGATLQLVTTSGGDYYGPIVLGWKSKTQVYTKFGTKTSGKGKIKVGTIKVSAATTAQGYGKVTKKLSLAKKTIVSATNYKPVGVGTYGKAAGGATATLRGITNINSADLDIRLAVEEAEKFDGGDADADGLPNAFDVNDDGDALLDAADSNSPAPNAGANCVAGASFNIFTNFKSTATNFAGNINAYGSGSYGTSASSINNALTNILSIVMQPITSVCGSSVVKSEFKGVGSLPYAPSDYVDITGKSGGTGDYQWTVGTGQISGNAVSGLSAYTFTDPKQISGQDVLMQRVTTADGNVYEFAGTMGFVFISHPLPLAYTIASGSETSFFQSGVTNYGTSNKLSLGSSSSLSVKIAVPQRLGIDGEGADYMDLGGLAYIPDIPNGFGGGNGPGRCDAAATQDTAADSAVGTSARTVTMTFTLGTCFTARSMSWGTSGQELQGGLDIQVVPIGGGGNSAQKIGIAAQ